jgi:CubicO group peptidase (beta-lactamase class C family)
MKQITYISIILLFYTNFVYGQDGDFTGYATSIVEQNKVVIKTFGFKDKNRKVKYDSLTTQPIASVSKVIIGLAIMKAIELGFINLDTDINEYLNFKIVNPNLRNYQKITMKHLATHTSGIRDKIKFYTQSYTKGLKSPYTLEEYLKSYFTEGGKRYSKKNFGKNQPGEEYSYSNIGAALAAYVIESASKIPFELFTEKYLFQPLGMNHTHWHYNGTQIEKYTQLFDKKDNPLDYYALATYPDGGLKSNIVDLSKLLQALIKGYQGDGDILSNNYWKVFFEKNFSETSPIKGINPKEPNHGIFIVYAKSGSIGHTGSDPGVSVIMFFDPTTKRGKIFMANEDLIRNNLNSFKTIWENL